MSNLSGTIRKILKSPRKAVDSNSFSKRTSENRRSLGEESIDVGPPPLPASPPPQRWAPGEEEPKQRAARTRGGDEERVVRRSPRPSFGGRGDVGASRSSGTFHFTRSRRGDSHGSSLDGSANSITPVSPPNPPPVIARPSREVDCEVELSTRAILKAARRFVRVRLSQDDVRGIVYSSPSRNAYIDFVHIEAVQLESEKIFVLRIRDDEDIVLRVKEGCMLLVQDLAKWVSFVTQRPLGDVLLLNAQQRTVTSAGAASSGTRDGEPTAAAVEGEAEAGEHVAPYEMTSESFVVPELEYESMLLNGSEVNSIHEVYVTGGGSVLDRPSLLQELNQCGDEYSSTTTMVSQMLLDETGAAPDEEEEDEHLSDEDTVELEEEEQMMTPTVQSVIVCPSCEEVVYGGDGNVCPHCNEPML